MTVFNKVELGGRVQNNPKGGFSKDKNIFYIQFILSVPKRKSLDYGSMNFIACQMWGEQATEAMKFLKKDCVVKVFGKINTYTSPGKSGFSYQVIVNSIKEWDPSEEDDE